MRVKIEKMYNGRSQYCYFMIVETRVEDRYVKRGVSLK